MLTGPPEGASNGALAAQALADRGLFGPALTAAEAIISAASGDGGGLPDAAASSSAVRALLVKASILRQLGQHSRARGCDGAALTAARTLPADAGRTDGLRRDGSPARSLLIRDAYLGLAADAVGAPDAVRARAFLASADATVIDPPWWSRVRGLWVQAEVDLITDRDARAVARDAITLCRAAPGDPVRYRAKSELFAAIACDVAGDPERERHAENAIGLAGDYGLTPLEWPAQDALSRWACAAGDQAASHRHARAAAAALERILESLPSDLRESFAASPPVLRVMAKAYPST